ncbi:hypothetical protein NPIL_258441 [Nephila pilipes]|uniref:Uncharacterized protein n=1 Tax=Nephila pilipes TaxID=299642 RepID=A0A8X6QVU2_NEPPI|nr:hypothetical protein NPIL_258441 [Nephila pilipes]
MLRPIRSRVKSSPIISKDFQTELGPLSDRCNERAVILVEKGRGSRGHGSLGSFRTHEPWSWQLWTRRGKTLPNKNIKNPSSLPRTIGLACFRMITGHDYLQKHLQCLGFKDSACYPLCHHGDMDGVHLKNCS